MTRPEGTLTDTGPLFAMADPQGQPEQCGRCQALLPSLGLPLVTTWPCFAEALYLCGKQGRWPMQDLLWGRWRDGSIRIHALSDAETARIAVLMEQYWDTPMDAADASLIALAETQGYPRVFSLDSDFYIYRLADGRALEVIPGPMPRPPRR